jgi:hypothetical protein
MVSFTWTKLQSRRQHRRPGNSRMSGEEFYRRLQANGSALPDGANLAAWCGNTGTFNAAMTSGCS